MFTLFALASVRQFKVMYLKRVLISNVRSIAHLEWRPPLPCRAGWHVILGDNGSGKSSFLRSVALALIGPKEALASRQNWSTWLRSEQSRGEILVELVPDGGRDRVIRSKAGVKAKVLTAGLSLSRSSKSPSTVELDEANTKRLSAYHHVWGGGVGWFSAAYGPFRRFSGGDKEEEKIFSSNPRLGAHISIFGENVALPESLYWLRELHYKRLENRSSSEARLLKRISDFVNQEDFLPYNVRFKSITSDAAIFDDANEFPIAVNELSDGYRSMLSMTFELLRQITRNHTEDTMFDKQSRRVIVPGVVMIDEIDAHLHPTWQKRIGLWLTKHFPNLQFIVTTHSPLICQAAQQGSIFHLPTPGTSEQGRMLEGADRDRLLYGDILEAYSTEAFGPANTRSQEGQRLQNRLAILNVKEMHHPLSDEEREEQEKLRAAFPTSANDTLEHKAQ